MKLRTITTILALLTVLSLGTSSYFYYTFEKKDVFGQIKKKGVWHAELMTQLIENHISGNLRTVKSLSGYAEIKHLFSEMSESNLNGINRFLDNFKTSFDADVSYIMDREGNTIASSNRNDPDSFVGKNYRFRPYFKKAILGQPFVYMALGVTSKKRGIYFSCPIYTGEKTAPSGVAVMKFSASHVEKEILNLHFDMPGMTTLLVAPGGVIFMSDKKEYVLHRLEEKPDTGKMEMSEIGQFGGRPKEWSGFGKQNNGRMQHSSGHEYLVFEKELKDLPGWRIIHLHDIKVVHQLLKRSTSVLLSWILISMLLFSTLVFFLYGFADREIVHREKIERALEESKKFLKSLLEAIPIPVFYKDRQGRYQGFNKAFETFFGEKRQDLIGKSVFDISPDELARIYHEKDAVLFENGGLQRYESEVQNDENMRRKVIFDKSVFRDNQNEIAGLIGTITDITERKIAEQEREKLILELRKALAEIKTLKGIVPICSSCKKIRNDQGYWDHIESYIKKHSDAEFSHGICPDCMEKLYGQEAWFDNLKDSKQGD